MSLSRRDILKAAAAGAGCVLLPSCATERNAMNRQPNNRPNIIYILADDLGYGDVSCFNPQGKIPTPHLDRLAAGGMRFTDAHATSAVCSPSRYGVLTGRYNWRTRLQSGIVGVYGDPLIAPDRLTVAGLLKQSGYATACIGKWHLGQGWAFEPTIDFVPDRSKGATPATPQQQALWREAFSKPTTGGPTTRGFDYYFGTDVPNWPPYCYIENDRTVGIPTEFLPARLIGNNQGSIPGPALAGWNFEQLLPTYAQRAGDYIRRQARQPNPFFLYMPLTSPHTPLAVNDEWKGKSGLNLYADFVMETDAIVGRVLDALEQSGAADNTIVMFASDNGCAPYIGVPEMEAKGHFPSAQYRGYKADAWDGGHRIPFIARWPGVVKPGRTCDQTVCLSDLMATCSQITAQPLPDTAGEDSVSLLPLLQGQDRPVREHVVHHSITGKFAIRSGKWKLVLCGGSGGWASPNDAEAAKLGLPSIQLYDMQADPGERTNLHAERADVVETLSALLQRLVDAGRSTPGRPQSNDVPVDIWKGSSKTEPDDA
ncbi:MAG: sulfatase-like hydrolase/transferase [Planctomycetaceae bacterium]|nr:sulfatase-like hydrolase/transferase [Planctomycetaceae bacterium]